MKTKILLSAICSAAVVAATSCFGLDAVVSDGYYGDGYDGLWYNGYGYGSNYYGGYWGPDYGWGPGVPPPLIGGPGPARPPQVRPPQSSPGASSVPNGPVFPTRPDGSQRPGNNGLPTGRPIGGGQGSVSPGGAPVALPDAVPVPTSGGLSPGQTSGNRGRR